MEATLDAPLMSPPPIVLALTEGHRAAGEFALLALSRRWLRKMPAGDGHGVMILPGFMGDDGYNAPLRKYLASLNYLSCGWGQGRNLGPRGDLLDRTLERMAELADETGARFPS